LLTAEPASFGIGDDQSYAQSSSLIGKSRGKLC